MLPQSHRHLEALNDAGALPPDFRNGHSHRPLPRVNAAHHALPMLAVSTVFWHGPAEGVVLVSTGGCRSRGRLAAAQGAGMISYLELLHYPKETQK